MATLSKAGEFDPAKHPRDHGKFSHSEGAGGDDKPNMRDRMREGGDLHGKATASLKDHAFVAQHAERLSRASDEARSNFPRDPHGKDADAAVANHTHGEAMRIHAEEEAHGGDGSLKESAHDARAISRSNGGGLEAQHAAAMDAIHSLKREAAETKAAREAEDHAVAAGHVSPEARQIADEYAAGHHAREKTINEHADALDKAHREAATALAALHEYGSDDHKDLEFDHHLYEGFDETQTALHGAVDRDEHEQYASSHESSRRELPQHPDDALPEDYHDYVPHPDHSERELSDHEYDQQLAAHQDWRAKAEAEHDAALDAHRAEFRRRAEVAQTALETLHAHQHAAHAALKDVHQEGAKAESAARRRLDKIDPAKQVNDSAFAHHERDENGDFKDTAAQEAYDGAHHASESMLDHASSRLDEHGHRDLSDALNSLKESTRSTAGALKRLGTITGRAPKLPESRKPKAKTKKSAWRYCPECGRQLAEG